MNPEIGGHMANRTAALGMFSMTLHDRPASRTMPTALKGMKNASSVWLRITGIVSVRDAVSRSLRLKGDTYTTQLGGDIINWNNDAQDTTIRGGIMGAPVSLITPAALNGIRYESRCKIDRAYSVGLYGTGIRTAKMKTMPMRMSGHSIPGLIIKSPWPAVHRIIRAV